MHMRWINILRTLQVANYPSQLLPPGPHDLRKKAHADSGTLTLLASQDYLPGSGWQAGDGGLQLLSAAGQWLEVEVPPGEGGVMFFCHDCCYECVTFVAQQVAGRLVTEVCSC
jgi:isopenicillin N synthase-like dioxygenase